MDILTVKKSLDFKNDDSITLLKLFDEIDDYLEYLNGSILEIKDED